MKLSERKKKILREYIDFICESCHKPETEVGVLEIHRIRPGNENGDYSIRNIKIVCKKCHEIFSSAQRIAMGIQ